MALLRLNNTMLSWNSCSLKIDGVPYDGLTAVSYSQKRERPQIYGMRKNGGPMGKPAGKYSVDSCSMTFFRDEFDALTTQLALKGLGSYGDAEFTFVLTYFEPVAGAQAPITVVGSGCTIETVKDTNQEGTEALLTEVEINCMSILVNGKALGSLVRTLSPI